MIEGPLPTSLSHPAVHAVMGALACFWARQQALSEMLFACSPLPEPKRGGGEFLQRASAQQAHRSAHAGHALSCSSACTPAWSTAGRRSRRRRASCNTALPWLCCQARHPPKVGVKAPLSYTPGAYGLPAAAACACELACAHYARIRTASPLGLPHQPRRRAQRGRCNILYCAGYSQGLRQHFSSRRAGKQCSKNMGCISHHRGGPRALAGAPPW